MILLSQLEESYIQNIEWLSAIDLLITVEKDEEIYKISFSGISLFRMYTSKVTDVFLDNEIWRIEEPEYSHTKTEIVSDNNFYWLSETINDYYKRSHPVDKPENIRHIIILSDYIDIEILCSSYNVNTATEYHGSDQSI
jgi:hypothetical protein